MKRHAAFADIARAMSKIDFCMMHTVGPDGVATRPMSNNGEVEYDGDNWFFSAADADKVQQIERDDRVHLTFGDAERAAFIAVWGTGEIVTDAKKKKALWQKELERWFPDGPDSDDVVLVKVHAHKLQTWGSLGDHVLEA